MKKSNNQIMAFPDETAPHVRNTKSSSSNMVYQNKNKKLPKW